MKMSLKERDRRYKLIRQGMEEQGVDVIVAAALERVVLTGAWLPIFAISPTSTPKVPTCCSPEKGLRP